MEDIVVDEHGLIEKLARVRNKALKVFRELTDDEEIERWVKHKDDLKNLEEEYRGTKRTLDDFKQAEERFHVLLAEMGFDESMIDSFPPATFVPVTVSNGHVVCESLLGSTVGTERSVFPPIPLSEIEHGIQVKEKRRLQHGLSNQVNITENFLEQQPEPFDALLQSVSYANTASMKILLQTGDRRQSAMEDIDRRRLGISGKRVLRSMTPTSEKSKYFCACDGRENDLRVVDAGHMGKGVISCTEIKSGEFVMEYKGILITRKNEADKRRAELIAEGKESYLMMIVVKNGKKNWVDGSDPNSGKGRFVNHLKRGYNLHGKIQYDEYEKPHVAFFSCRHIKRGDFLYYNYGGYFHKDLEPWSNDTFEDLPNNLVSVSIDENNEVDQNNEVEQIDQSGIIGSEEVLGDENEEQVLPFVDNGSGNVELVPEADKGEEVAKGQERAASCTEVSKNADNNSVQESGQDKVPSDSDSSDVCVERRKKMRVVSSSSSRSKSKESESEESDTDRVMDENEPQHSSNSGTSGSISGGTNFASDESESDDAGVISEGNRHRSSDSRSSSHSGRAEVHDGVDAGIDDEKLPSNGDDELSESPEGGNDHCDEEESEALRRSFRVDEVFATDEVMKSWPAKKFIKLLWKVVKKKPGARCHRRLWLDPTDENIRKFAHILLQEKFFIRNMIMDMTIMNKSIDFEEKGWYENPSNFKLTSFDSKVPTPSCRVIPRPSRDLTGLPLMQWDGNSVDKETLMPDYCVLIELPGEEELVPVVRISPNDAPVHFCVRLDDVVETVGLVQEHLESNLVYVEKKMKEPPKPLKKDGKKKKISYLPSNWALSKHDNGRARNQYYMQIVARSVFPADTARTMAPVVTCQDFTNVNLYPFCYYREQVVGTQLLPAVHKLAMKFIEESGTKYSRKALDYVRKELVELSPSEFEGKFTRWGRFIHEQFTRKFFNMIIADKKTAGTLQDCDKAFLKAFMKRTQTRPAFHRGESLLTCAGRIPHKFMFRLAASITPIDDSSLTIPGYGRYSKGQKRPQLFLLSAEEREKRILRKAKRVEAIKAEKARAVEVSEDEESGNDDPSYEPGRRGRKTKKTPEKLQKRKTRKIQNVDNDEADESESETEGEDEDEAAGSTAKKTPKKCLGGRKKSSEGTKKRSARSDESDEADEHAGRRRSVRVSRMKDVREEATSSRGTSKKTSRNTRKKEDEETSESESGEPAKRKKTKGKKKGKDGRMEHAEESEDSATPPRVSQPVAVPMASPQTMLSMMTQFMQSFMTAMQGCQLQSPDSSMLPSTSSGSRGGSRKSGSAKKKGGNN